ncbi:MAG: hypothetical protein ABIF82_10805 [Planctomycetota bacterium]
MSEKTERTKGRRDFVCALLRWATLGGLVGGTLGLMSRRRDGRQKLACINDANCRTCSKCCDCPLSEYESPGCGHERAPKS